MYKQIAVLVLLGYTVLGLDLKCSSPFGNILDDDCSTMWQCVWWKPVKMPECFPGLVYSSKYRVCVTKGSFFDDCHGGPMKIDNQCQSIPCKNGGQCYGLADGESFYCTCPPTHAGPTCETAVTSLNIEDICRHNKNMIIPHPTECQQYYNCSDVYITVPRFFNQYLHECPYPQLFSATTLKCEAFKDVKCGARHEHKSGCDYLSNRCPVAHCRPCDQTYPSCEGKDDGIHPHASRPNSPFFMECQGERTVSTGMCPVDTVSRKQMFIKNGSCTIFTP